MRPISSNTPSDTETVFGSRSTIARSQVRLIEEKMCDLIVEGARSVKQINPPLLKAQFAVLILDQIAQQLDPKIPPEAFARLWSRWPVRTEVTDSINTLRAAFSLHSEVLQGFRESNPSFCFKYILYRELFHGRLPVLATDLKDSLAAFVNGRRFDSLSPREQSAAAGFRGVREALDQLMKTGPVYLITGDTHETVVEQFVTPNQWVRNSGGVLEAVSPVARNLVWLPRTGMEIVRFDKNEGHFVRSQLVPGIRPQEVSTIQEILAQVSEQLAVRERFGLAGTQYAHRPGHGPGSIERRTGAQSEDVSVAFYPAGILEASARTAFKADPANASFLEVLVCKVNEELSKAGLEHIRAKRGGLSTVDLVTSDKGVALSRIKNDFLVHNEVVVFIGDRIALNGNDVEASEVADLSIQVGSEWDPQLFPKGDRTLLRSKRLAAEGGSAEFISDLARIRSLGITELLNPLGLDPLEVSLSRGSPQSLSPSDSPSPLRLPPPPIQGLIHDTLELRDEIIRSPQEKRPLIAQRLRESLALSVANDHLRHIDPLTRLDLCLLKRAIKGYVPIPASDIKDTLAQFDGSSFGWFPEVRDALGDALAVGPVFLLTGESVRNVRDRFLFPGGLVSQQDSHLTSSFPGIYNLNIIARGGLDRIIFNFATGQLERIGLVSGISKRDAPLILDILQRAQRHYLTNEFFEGYGHEVDYPPGWIDVRGAEYGEHDASLTFYPAGVLLAHERERFRRNMSNHDIYRALVGYIRSELYALQLNHVLAHRGGISTIDLTTTTKGTAVAQIRQQLLGPRDYFVYMGDTVAQSGNDGSTVGIADYTVNVGVDRDGSVDTPRGHVHFQSPTPAREGATARIIRSITAARLIATMNVWD